MHKEFHVMVNNSPSGPSYFLRVFPVPKDMTFWSAVTPDQEVAEAFQEHAASRVAEWCSKRFECGTWLTVQRWNGYPRRNP
jgi:hypothetical protein